MQAALKESEERYRGIFENSAVSIWAEDISGLRAFLGTLRPPETGDLDAWFRERPEVVREAMRRVRVVDVNGATLHLFGAMSKEQFLGPLERSLDVSGLPLLAGSLAAVARGERSFELETTLSTSTGRRLEVIISATVPPAGQPDQRMARDPHRHHRPQARPGDIPLVHRAVHRGDLPRRRVGHDHRVQPGGGEAHRISTRGCRRDPGDHPRGGGACAPKISARGVSRRCGE